MGSFARRRTPEPSPTLSRMKRTIQLTLSFMIASVLFSPLQAADHGYKVVGYVAGWSKLDYDAIDVTKLTHINYAFANVSPAGEVVFGGVIDGVELSVEHFRRLNSLKKKNPELKLMISVGGWTWSKNFSDAALTRETRKKFSASAVKLMKENNLDGVDVDWEYPGQIGDNNKFRPEDKRNFTLLMQSLREELDRQSDSDGRKGANRYLLTIATGADAAYLENTTMRDVQQYLDFLNIMTYDFHNGLHHQSGHHGNLRRSKVAGATMMNVEDSVQSHIDAGIPARKIVLGIPFYGRRWKGVPSTNHGLYQSGNSTGEIVPYKDILAARNDFTEHWDDDANAAYLYCAKQATVITYETPRSILLKTEYLKRKGLGGVMFWEYSYDDTGALLDAVDDGLRRDMTD